MFYAHFTKAIREIVLFLFLNLLDVILLEFEWYHKCEVPKLNILHGIELVLLQPHKFA